MPAPLSVRHFFVRRRRLCRILDKPPGLWVTPPARCWLRARGLIWYRRFGVWTEWSTGADRKGDEAGQIGAGDGSRHRACRRTPTGHRDHAPFGYGNSKAPTWTKQVVNAISQRWRCSPDIGPGAACDCSKQRPSVHVHEKLRGVDGAVYKVLCHGTLDSSASGTGKQSNSCGHRNTRRISRQRCPSHGPGDKPSRESTRGSTHSPLPRHLLSREPCANGVSNHPDTRADEASQQPAC